MSLKDFMGDPGSAPGAGAGAGSDVNPMNLPTRPKDRSSDYDDKAAGGGGGGSYRRDYRSSDYDDKA
eukprot:CAMPEP_0203668680 /NCGR_PEP_ID=MMETSP0090-20130426/5249_1 /ASSEMBLY_ACC=CAM_ASM_001088 /TAXON_ID=426623 /ORGANISM="Chaetoceros affinis, Strain CCMP159" /LENGTH=66 /DNA_ID=CAMNT_0050533181 /DNA_START=256 /DNA_END=453 /DNA_ORIENTATION=-